MHMLVNVQCQCHVQTPNMRCGPGCSIFTPSLIVQAGAWDVDDTGLEYMPTKDLAERIQKVRNAQELNFSSSQQLSEQGSGRAHLMHICGESLPQCMSDIQLLAGP